MNLYCLLIGKDLRRAWKNPLPYLIFLLIPLLITGLLGLVFGGSNARSTGPIKFAIVDEDQSVLTRILQGALPLAGSNQQFEPVFLERTAALQKVTNNQLSAALILPKGFLKTFCLTEDPIRLELVKNPAQSIHPSVIEELSRLLTTGLNALARTARPELARWGRIVQSNSVPDMVSVASELGRTGEKIQAVESLVRQPRIQFVTGTEDSPAKPEQSGRKESGARKSAEVKTANVFGWVLPGLSAMFLLFLADVAMRDFSREVQQRTFSRYRTLPRPLFGFVCSKVLFGVILLMICAGILFGVGSLIFRVQWAHPVLLAIVVASYSLFAAGLLSALCALAGAEKRSTVINNVVLMILGMASGCAFPAEAFPEFMRAHIIPLLPSAWLIEAVHSLQHQAAGPAWWHASCLLAGLGMALSVFATWTYQRKLVLRP